MSVKRWPRLLLGAILFLPLGTAGAAAAHPLQAPTASRAIAIPHYAMNTYTIKVGVKGGESLVNNNSGPTNGDMVQERASGSFSLDGTYRRQVFFSGKLPRGFKNTASSVTRSIVNGTWSAKGTKWTDVAHRITGPFTCAGRIDTSVKPSQMSLAWKRSGARLVFDIAVVQQELYNKGAYEACPNDSALGWLQATPPTVYESHFSVPVASIGSRRFSAHVSGPLAVNRHYFLQNCPRGAGNSCNLAWQGTVQFTRTKVIRFG